MGDVESGRFEDEYLGVKKVPNTEVAEEGLPQTSLKAHTTGKKLLGRKTGKMSGKKTGKMSGVTKKSGVSGHRRSRRRRISSLRLGHHGSSLHEMNVKRIQAHKNWLTKRKMYFKARKAHMKRREKSSKAARIVRAKKQKAREKHRKKNARLNRIKKKEKGVKKKKRKEKNAKQQKVKSLAREKMRKEKREKERVGKRKKARAKETRAKKKKVRERKAKLAEEKRGKRRKLRRLRAKELQAKARAILKRR